MAIAAMPEDEGASERAASWRRAALWLLFLAPFFYLTYGGANHLAGLRNHVPSVVYGWERHIPFIAWSILPYWSINLFYALSLFVSRSPEEVDRLARRYLTVQIVAVLCFVAFPLKATFSKPETDGLPGFLFDLLGGFDKPFNQAPSLHIALLVIIWDHMRRRLGGYTAALWHAWCLLIGASVLTTFQHHAIDIPTGAALGVFALWLHPADRASPLSAFTPQQDRKAWTLARRYGFGALLFLAAAFAATRETSLGLLLLWPALALAIVAVGYAGSGTDVFQKDKNGRQSVPARMLLLPYKIGAWVNRMSWTSGFRAQVCVCDTVWIGRFPRWGETLAFASVIDLSAEFARPDAAVVRWHAYPSLDLLAPDAELLRAAAARIEAERQHGAVLVCCALGFQRSALAIVAWLVATGRVPDEAAARRLLAGIGRPVHLPPLDPAAEPRG